MMPGPSARWISLPVLGLTQIISWGTSYYTIVLTGPQAAAEQGWSNATAIGGITLALLTAGAASPRVGILIDRLGGAPVMAVGSGLTALGMAVLALMPGLIGWYLGWAIVGVAMAATLYDAAFATLVGLYGAGARRPITILTLAGGLASTAGWPATHFLINAIGWRDTYLVYAGVHLLLCLPLHALALPRQRADETQEVEAATVAHPTTTAPPRFLPASGLIFTMLVLAFAANSIVFAGLSAQLLAFLDRLGLDTVTTVWIGTIIGPAQSLARLGELTLARDAHPLSVARFTGVLIALAFLVLAVFGVSVATTIVFAVFYGTANGLKTIVRGTLPLSLFGAAGYARLIGRIAGPVLILQAAAPVGFALFADAYGVFAALMLAGSMTVLSLVAFFVLRRP